jgi:hypothetical protein
MDRIRQCRDPRQCPSQFPLSPSTRTFHLSSRRGRAATTALFPARGPHSPLEICQNLILQMLTAKFQKNYDDKVSEK